ncbi:MAG: hypothetical protein ACO3F3_18855 [Gemmataceae bacterium]
MSSDNKGEKRLDFIVAKEGNKPLILSPEKLKELVSRGEIKGDDLIFRENLKVWTKARYVKGLRSLIARLETSSTGEEEDSEDDLIDELLNDFKTENEPEFNQKENENLKNTEYPPALAGMAVAKNFKSQWENTSTQASEKGIDQAISRMRSSEIGSEKYPEINLPNSSTVKTYVQYGIIVCFLMVLLYHFFPRSTGEVITATEYLHGAISLNGEPLRNGSIVVMGSDGKEVYGFIEPKGTYRVEDPPRGILKMKIVSFPPPPSGTMEPKKESKAKLKEKTISPLAKYASFENEISIDYQGGKKVFDLKLSSK